MQVTIESLPVVLNPRPRRARNDPGQYEDLVDEWWRDSGAFAMLQWIARARAWHIPAATRPGAVLVDVGCGGGLLAPYARARGYHHVGVDLVAAGLREAARHGVVPVRADVLALPLADACADVVSAGEILEHVRDPSTVLAEAARILRPGGTLVLDTINSTAVARFVAVTVAERLGGVAVRGIHDPRLFVPPSLIVAECARHGVAIRVRGLRPKIWQLVRWLATRRGAVAMVPTRFTAVLYQGWGVKRIGVTNE